MKKRSLIVLLVLVMAFVLSLPAFAAIDWRQFEGTEIRILLNRNQAGTIIEEAIPEFEEKTGIEINTEVYPEDQFRQKRLVELNAGGDVDGFMMMPAQVKAYYYNAGFLQPLEKYMVDPSLTDYEVWKPSDFQKAPMEGGRIEGHQVGIPTNVETSLLSYRKDLFEKYDVKVPETMEEMEEAAEFFHGKEVNGQEMIGITLRGKGAAATSQWVEFLYSFGGSWLDEQGNAAVGSPEAIESIKFYGGLLNDYGPEGAEMNHWMESLSLFAEGRAAMIFDACNFKMQYEDPEESNVAGKVGYSIIPEGPAGSVPHVAGWHLAIANDTTDVKKKAMWLFIQQVTNYENSVKSLLESVPVGRSDAWQSERFTHQDEHPDWTQAVNKAFDIGQTVWNPPVLNVAEVRDIVGQAIITAIQGGDVESAAKEAEQEMNEKMKMPGE